MPLFKIMKTKAKRIRPVGVIRPEDKLQNIIEQNLSVFFPNFVLIKHKPVYEHKEFDTLAFDKSTNTPVIFEYKVSRDRAVGDQVDSYLAILMKNKELFRYHLKDVLRNVKNIDFRMSRVIIIANDFSDVQINALSLRQDYVEMWRYNYYEGFLLLENIKPLPIPGLTRFRRGKIGEASKDITKYEDISHFKPSSSTEKLYNELRETIKSLDPNMQFKINKHFIGYKAGGFYFAAVKPRVNSIKVELKLSKPFKSKVITVKKIPSYRRTPMTKWFIIDSEEQIPTARKVLKMALEESL